MKLWRCLILAAAVVGAPCAGARPAADLADVQAMTALFDQVCLRAFPDLAAVDRVAAALRAVPMTAVQVRSYLHADPGQGWLIARPEASYALTIERPPYRTCALRRMTSFGFATVQPMLDAVQGYAAARPGSTLVPGGRQRTVLDGGVDLDAWTQGLLPAGGSQPTDAFMVLVTNYHGHYANASLPDWEPRSPGVEIRFAHTVLAGR